MKKTILTAFIATLAILSVSAFAEPIGYPGSNWSELTVNPGVIKNSREENNVLLQGKIEQGVDWTMVGPFKLNTYASLGYSVDKNQIDYNNKLVPALGVKLVRELDGGVVNIGVQIVHENHFRYDAASTGPNRGTGIQLYANYWFGWNLKK